MNKGKYKIDIYFLGLFLLCIYNGLFITDLIEYGPTLKYGLTLLITLCFSLRFLLQKTTNHHHIKHDNEQRTHVCFSLYGVNISKEHRC